ncbi:uncharacterized protein [Miscanthus floridulus]|uniref:uncharacterized protein n=1 Tax=Miscanthus floridulus TaxID=154761 RepID=UPI0034577990
MSMRSSAWSRTSPTSASSDSSTTPSGCGRSSSAKIETPFGRRTLLYTDHTAVGVYASGRSLHSIEDYILKHVLPFCGNTHTDDVGSKTTRMARKAASYIKRKSVRCMGAGLDALLFCGSGTMAAAKRLQEAIGVACPRGAAGARRAARAEERWVMFLGPYEHHSNLLSWRQSMAEAPTYGLVDLRRAGSPEYANHPMLRSFSACSNVTSVQHRHPRHRTHPALEPPPLPIAARPPQLLQVRDEKKSCPWDYTRLDEHKISIEFKNWNDIFYEFEDRDDTPL